MSRELKFRAWDIEAKKMRHIIMGLRYALHGLIACEWCDGGTLDTQWLQNDADCVGGKDRFILEEWTGLLDKEGVKIYEGDVVRHRGGDTWVVEFEYGEADGWSWQGYSCFCKSEWGRIEIVGNIHQNPELLKQ